MSKVKKDNPTEFALIGSPTADTTSARHEIDRLIRDRGYEIHSRPKRGEATWHLRGFPDVWWTQSEVLRMSGLGHLVDSVQTVE